MTTYTHTEPIPSRESDAFVTTVRSRRRFSIHNRHAPSCRIKGMGF